MGLHMKKVLLIGAAGSIGTSLRNALGQAYHFRCFDKLPTENEANAVIGNIMNLDELASAMGEMNAVIHLAANPRAEQAWENVYAEGIGGTYNVFDAARQAGIKKVIYASSTAVLGWRELQQGKRVSPNMPVYPTTLYGIGKATGELLARYFSETYEMSIVCLRIGYFYTEPPYPQSPRDEILSAWCSPEDLADLVQRCLETDGLGFRVFYGVSNNRRRLWDIRNARELVRYQPESNAEDLIGPPIERKKERVGLKNHHRLLIRAALQDAPEAFQSWKNWANNVDFEKTHLDTLSYRLLPLVYYNLSNQNIDDPLISKLKGVYRRSWLENQLSLKQVMPFITQLKEQSISVMLLDDMASILLLYDGQGARRLYSFDLLVHPSDVSKLVDFLLSHKIWPKVSYASRFLTVESPLEIWPPFNLPLTVAWRVHPAVRTSEQALKTWERAHPAMLGDFQMVTLNLESHFLRSCLRAVGTRPETAFFALIDVAWMLAKKSGDIDWKLVLQLAQENYQVIPVTKCLNELADIISLPAGSKLLAKLQAMPVSWIDELDYYWLYQYRPYPGLLIRLGRRLLLYRHSPKIPGLFGFARYLQFAWGGARLRSILRLSLLRLRKWKKP